jgi:hypothetical protein
MRARALEPEVAVDMLLSNRLSFFRGPRVALCSIVGPIHDPIEVPQAWLVETPRFGDEWTERRERLKLTPTQIVRRTRRSTPARRPRNAEVIAGDMEEGGGLG